MMGFIIDNLASSKWLSFSSGLLFPTFSHSAEQKEPTYPVSYSETSWFITSIAEGRGM